MANLTLRLVKGSPLTYAEVDDNFTALNDATGHFKNAIINGNFDIWQRGTNFIASSGYSADRWRYTFLDGAGAVSRQAFTVGQTAVPGEPRYFLRHARTSAATANNTPIEHRIESVRTFAGQQVTWSFWAKVSSGTKVLTPRMRQNFGTGGSASAEVIKSGSDITLTTSWQEFVVTITLDSISGKTIGTNNNDHLSLDLLEGSSFGTFTMDFAQAQLEKGDEDTEFERRPLQTELALCQRYYEKSYNINVDPATVTNSGVEGARQSGTNLVYSIIFKVSKRVAPTATFYSPVTGATGNWRDTNAGADVAVSATGGGGTSGVQENNIGVVASGADTNIVVGHWTADAEL